MLGLDLTALKGYAERRAVDIQELGCLIEIHPPFGILALSRVTRNFVIGSQSDDPLFCPPITTARPQTIAGENARDHFIGTNARQNPHCFHNVLWSLCAILTAPSAAYTQLSMNPALPMNDQDKFASIQDLHLQ